MLIRVCTLKPLNCQDMCMHEGHCRGSVLKTVCQQLHLLSLLNPLQDIQLL